MATSGSCFEAAPDALYALVTYVPDPLGARLDRIRRRIAPWMPPSRSHVTILAPRPIPCAPKTIWDDWKLRTAGFSSFEIELGSVEVFTETEVVYLAVGEGSDRLSELHHLLNSNGTRYREAFPFQPHITLAQDVPADRVANAVDEARAMWAEIQLPRSFAANRFHLARNEGADSWVDVDTLELR